MSWKYMYIFQLEKNFILSKKTSQLPIRGVGDFSFFEKFIKKTIIAP